MNAFTRELTLPAGPTVGAAALRAGTRYFIETPELRFCGTFDGFSRRSELVTFSGCILFEVRGAWRTPTPREAGLGGRINVSAVDRFTEAMG